VDSVRDRAEAYQCDTPSLAVSWNFSQGMLCHLISLLLHMVLSILKSIYGKRQPVVFVLLLSNHNMITTLISSNSSRIWNNLLIATLIGY
jgi:hypothetical protein